VSALSAIDDNEYDRLPALTYARGFIRLYAREVGVNPDTVLEAFDAHQAQHEMPEPESPGYTPYVTGARRGVGARRAHGTSVGLAVGAVVMAILVVIFWNPTDGVDQVPLGADFSPSAIELPLERP